MRNNNKNSKQNAFHIKSGSFKDEFPVRISDTCETRLSTYYLLIALRKYQRRYNFLCYVHTWRFTRGHWILKQKYRCAKSLSPKTNWKGWKYSMFVYSLFVHLLPQSSTPFLQFNHNKKQGTLMFPHKFNKFKSWKNNTQTWKINLTQS